MRHNLRDREISFGLRAEELLNGAIDVHHHGFPEISLDLRTRQSDVEELQEARDVGMAGIVLKSHMWPTVGRAYHLNQRVTGITAFPSITLNPLVGGFSPLAVEAAARQGARVMFMPTWGAAHDQERKGVSAYLGKYLDSAIIRGPEGALRVTDAAGKVTPEVCECLAVAGEFGMAVGTAHISPRESIALAQRARDYNVHHVLFQHPDSGSVAATREETREMIAAGAIVELCALGILPPFQRTTLGGLLEMLEDAGPDQAVVTTDFFFDWVPSGPETLRMIVSAMLTAGISSRDVQKTVRDTPMRFLGLGDAERCASG